MSSRLLYKTKKEGRYLIRVVGLGMLLLLVLFFMIRNYFFLPLDETATPWFVFLILLVVLFLFWIANRSAWNAYVLVYNDKVMIQAPSLPELLEVDFDSLFAINGVQGYFVDLPLLPDLDKSNILSLELTNGKKYEVEIPCSRNDFGSMLHVLAKAVNTHIGSVE